MTTIVPVKAVFSGANPTGLSEAQAGDVIGVLNGGTGVSTLTGLVLGNGTGAFSAVTTSAGIAGAISDETGTGSLVFSNSPTLVTPSLGVASATTVNKLTLTTPATGATLTIADGKTLTVSNTLTFTGTDASSIAFGTGGTVAYTANNLSVFAATTSAQLAGVLSDETGSGKVVFGTSPTISTSLLTDSATFSLVNTTATTVNFAGATTTLSIGASTGTTTVNNTLTLTNAAGLSLTNATSNLISFNAVGSAAPTFTTRSAGAKVVLWNSLSGSTVGDFAIGVEPNYMWFQAPTTAQGYKWYAGTTNIATLDGTGNFWVGTAALATTATAGFIWIPSCAGAPTGAPTAPYTNAAALVVDTTNSKLYVRVGTTWKSTTLA